MRIANKIVLASLMMLAASPGRADPLSPPAPTAAMPIAAPSVAAPAVAAPQAANVAPLPPSPAIMPVGNESLEKTVSSMDDKVADSGHAMLRRLSGSSDGLNFEDLNNARQTVARIDAMIEIEKHLGDLEKLRNDRTGSSSNSLASVIPASALTPVVHTPPVVETPAVATPAPVFVSHEEVVRITGSEGKYAAVLKMSDGSTRTVTPGSELSHGSRVSWITPAAVGVTEEGGKSHTLHVKNVEMVYSTVR